jgi:hypothetical protein
MHLVSGASFFCIGGIFSFLRSWIAILRRVDKQLHALMAEAVPDCFNFEDVKTKTACLESLERKQVGGSRSVRQMTINQV